MKIFFISDLHLDEQRPDITSIFLHFLKNQAKHALALYILGDFFEVWIGDDHLTSFNQMISKALLNAVKQGLPIYFMRGNRDFLIGKKFLKASGCQLLPDEKVINLFGQPTLLMHGDSLCTLDVDYIKFRKKTRRWWVQQLFLMKSLEKRQAIAMQMRNASKQYVATASSHIMDVVQKDVEGVMVKHQVQHLIHGHTHRDAVHHFALNSAPATRTVLGAWHQQGNALICTEKKKELVWF